MCGFGTREADGDGTRTRDSAKAILERRYAEGEIDRTEYEEKNRVLAGGHNTHTAE